MGLSGRRIRSSAALADLFAPHSGYLRRSPERAVQRHLPGHLPGHLLAATGDRSDAAHGLGVHSR